MIEVVNKSVHV